MSQKSYISNISPLWPVERQMETLSGLLGSNTFFQDELKPYKRKPEYLKERAQMLRPTARNGGDTIYVASLACLALDAEDLMSVVTQANARGSTIRAIEEHVAITPKCRSDILHQVAKQFAEARTAAKEVEKGRAGGLKSGAVRSAAAKAAALSLKDRWGNSDYETSALLTEAGIPYNTAKLHLGSRKDALRYAAAATKRKAKKAKAA